MNPVTKPTAAGTTKKCSAVDFVFLGLGVFVAALCGLTAASHPQALASSKTFWALLLAALTLLAAPFLGMGCGGQSAQRRDENAETQENKIHRRTFLRRSGGGWFGREVHGRGGPA